MKFLSAKLLKPPVVTPIEYTYNSRDDGYGDEVRVRCDEWPVPEVVQQLQALSRPITEKMFGEAVAAAPRPFRYIVYGLELKEAGDSKAWGEEVAFNMFIGQHNMEVKIKTPFFGMYDTYQGKFPGSKENKMPELLGEVLTQEVRKMIKLFMAYMNGERAQQELHFEDEAGDCPAIAEHTDTVQIPLVEE